VFDLLEEAGLERARFRILTLRIELALKKPTRQIFRHRQPVTRHSDERGTIEKYHSRLTKQPYPARTLGYD